MPLQASQDDTRFSVFLNPIRDLTKNWEVDIAKYLEEYLVELAEIQVTFDGGETTMNFAEAAMLIQGTATVYSRKVEFLWQMVLQMLDLLSSKKSFENRDETDNTKASEDSRNKSKDISDDFSEMHNLKEGKNIDMKEDDAEEHTQKNSFRFLPAIPLHLVEKESEKSQMKIALYDKNMEIFGYKDDFRINRSYLTPSGLLCLELPQEILFQRVCLASQRQPRLNDSVAGFLPSDQLDSLPISNPIVDFENDDFNSCADLDPGGDNDNIEAPELFPRSPSPELVVERKQSDIIDSVSPLNDEVISNAALRNESQKRGQKESVASKVNIPVLLKPQDPHTEAPAKRPHRAGRFRKPMPCMCHKVETRRKRNRKSEQLNDIKTKTSLVERFIVTDLVNMVSSDNNNIKKDKCDTEPCLLEELCKENHDMAEQLVKIKAQEIFAQNNALTDQEIKEKIEEETKIKKKDANIEDDGVADLDFDDLPAIDDGPMNISIPTAHNDDLFAALADDCPAQKHLLNDSIMYEPASDYEALVQKWVAEYVTSAQEHIASSDLTKRVNKWRKIIIPKLNEEEIRSTFDIHEYGSYILSKLPQDGRTSVMFEDVVRGKDAKEVSRLFLSSLMLANTYNIDITQTEEGDLEMDCLQLTLLSRVRHHEILEVQGFQSPRKDKDGSEKRKDRSFSDGNRIQMSPRSQRSRKSKQKPLIRD